MLAQGIRFVRGVGWMRCALAMSLGVGACSASLPVGTFECAHDRDCPANWYCHAHTSGAKRCFREAWPDDLDAGATPLPAAGATPMSSQNNAGSSGTGAITRAPDAVTASDGGPPTVAIDGGGMRGAGAGGSTQNAAAGAGGSTQNAAAGAPAVMCPAGACAGGRCNAGAVDYTCMCDPGFSGTGTQACRDVRSCADAPACDASYPCVSDPLGYRCQGKFADTPFPDSTPGAATAPIYSADTVTVVDNVTHLVWEVRLPLSYAGCSGTSDPVDACDGGTSDAGCSSTPAPSEGCTWSEARTYCDNMTLGNHDDWRLPTKIELESIVDYTRVDPAIDAAFTNTKTGPYWTASALAITPGNAWYVDFSEGVSNATATHKFMRVRCVRAGVGAR